MTTMLEKAARALAKAEARGRVDLYANNPELYIRLARAALLAIREPDEDACLAACMTDGVASRFTAMLDAILAEETET